jgi:hypothetical protein
MAYNRPYNPDELPRFAEPEQKGGAKPSVAPSSSRYEAQPSSRYETKPPPPRPIELQHRPSDPSRHGSGRPPPQGNPPSSHGGSYGGRGAPDPRNVMSPPPAATGPRPTGQPSHSRPAQNSRPPPSPAPTDGNSDPTLLPLFRAVDKDGWLLTLPTVFSNAT